MCKATSLDRQQYTLSFLAGHGARANNNGNTARTKQKARARTHLGHARGLELLGDRLDQGPGIVGVLCSVAVLDAPGNARGGQGHERVLLIPPCRQITRNVCLLVGTVDW